MFYYYKKYDYFVTKKTEFDTQLNVAIDEFDTVADQRRKEAEIKKSVVKDISRRIGELIKRFPRKRTELMKRKSEEIRAL